MLAALVKRQRLETHTFLMPMGEVTVTLEDVLHIFGLLINGVVTERMPWLTPILRHQLAPAEIPVARRLSGSLVRICTVPPLATQAIPVDTHCYNLRGVQHHDWRRIHDKWIQQWGNCRNSYLQYQGLQPIVNFTLSANYWS
ncbi:hypothetical protein Ahy_A06g029228 [Arachis hypogaea]|uniref:Aminotransferase-like plant mobile domain-containing protein n=1 Tax=Arachis hypogaea TaxID=3818 RepID=A0A445CSY0_ARAHY|nr:hypothetical protein Ahy_A06g029228 [Arachis hypogaea]